VLIEFRSMISRLVRSSSSYQSGFSVVELVVAVGIGLTLLISLSSALITQQSDVQQLKQAVEANQLENDIRLVMGSETNCWQTLNTFGSKPPQTIGYEQQLNRIYYDNGNVAVQVGSIISSMIEVTGITLKTVAKPAAATSGRWLLEVAIYIKPIAGNASLQPRIIPVSVEVDRVTGDMVGCSVRVTEPPAYNCRTVRASASGTSATVTCPAQYRVVSCGMADSQSSKNNWRRVRPIPDQRRCFCYDANSSSISCYAVCCRG
jgi:hypothetical protein